MKKVILFAAIVSAFVTTANAKEISLSGEKAESFITRHLPDAEMPGPTKGTFEYTDKNGQVRHGYADCFVPAMGGRSEGFVSSCNVIY